MPISIVVPQLGESVAEGTVAKWLKAEGERVRKEEPLVEIQTDKINVEIPSPAEGVLSKILVAEGTTVLVGTEIATLAGAEEPALAVAAAPAAASTSRPSAPPAAAPLPTAPAPMPAAPQGGNGHGDTAALAEARNLSPAVRKIMREQNVSSQEVAAIHGSGIAGRVTRDDLIDYLKTRGSAAPTPAPYAPATAAPARPAAPPAPLPGFMAARTEPAAAGPREDVLPFTKVRKLI